MCLELYDVQYMHYSLLMSDDTSTSGTAATLIIPPELQEKYPDIISLILASESMNLTERQYWIDIMPVMTQEQMDQLRTILTNEREQLAAIDAKYATEIEKSGSADLEQTSEERYKKRQELSSKENVEQTEAEQKAEDILNQMD